MARKGARGSYIGAGTKQDVNLAHKTLFSLGKVVNGRLGSRALNSRRARELPMS